MNRLFIILTFAFSFSLGAEESTDAKILLHGRVLRPAQYVLSEDEQDLYHLILKAGGPESGAACGGDRVIIERIRNKKDTERLSYKIDVSRLMKEGPSSEMNHKVHDGDLIFVMEVGF